jgi:hypothetical protein
MEALKSTLAELLDSKKFMASLAGMIAAVLVTVLGHFHLALDPAAADVLSSKIIALVGTYVVGQGIADHGKERAKIENGGTGI